MDIAAIGKQSKVTPNLCEKGSDWTRITTRQQLLVLERVTYEIDVRTCSLSFDASTCQHRRPWPKKGSQPSPHPHRPPISSGTSRAQQWHHTVFFFGSMACAVTLGLLPSPPFCYSSKSVLLNLVLAVVLEGASDQMKEKHAAQKFRDNTLRLFHNQYKRLAMRRWSTKLQAEDMLKRGTHRCG